MPQLRSMLLKCRKENYVELLDICKGLDHLNLTVWFSCFEIMLINFDPSSLLWGTPVV